jgi:L-lactate dehydrogenase complex protein LldE
LKRPRVALFVTCLADQIYPEVGLATLRLLERLGCRVDFPEAQRCCGQPAFNSGYVDEARAVAKSLLDAFEDAEYVVSPSGSCAGMIRHYYAELFAGEPELAERASALASKTFELSQFLVQVLGAVDVGARFFHRVTYHASCHASRLLGAKAEPLALLSKVQGLELVPLVRCEDCCGFGGTFSVKLASVSAAMVDEKVDHVLRTEAEYLVGTDMGCLMNIAGRLERRGAKMGVLHLAQVLESEEGAGA